MPQVLVRDLDKETIERLKERARSHGRSLQAELKHILEAAARPCMKDFRAAVARIQKRFAGRVFSDSTDLIRQDRER
ncbi:MAG: Arc family DNA-binding protein [bacterium]